MLHSPVAQKETKQTEVRLLTLLVLSVGEAILGFSEHAQMGGKVVHQAGGEVRLPVHLFGPFNTIAQTVKNIKTTKPDVMPACVCSFIPGGELDQGVLQRLSDLQ